MCDMGVAMGVAMGVVMLDVHTAMLLLCVPACTDVNINLFVMVGNDGSFGEQCIYSGNRV